MLMHYKCEISSVCRKCIYRKISDEDVDSCPVCNIHLGCIPEEKLRFSAFLSLILWYLKPIKWNLIAGESLFSNLDDDASDRALSYLFA